MKRTRLIMTVAIGTVLLIGFIAGWYFGLSNAPVNASLAPVDIRANSLDYHFINPLLFSRTDKELYTNEFKALNEIINQKVQAALKDTKATSVSVYYRDMNNGHWTGINENEKYDPSSMLKVAVMMAYLKDSDKKPNLLKEKLYYAGPDGDGQYYKPADTLKPGNYTSEELIHAMMVYSDNVAMNALIQNDLEGFTAVYNDFRLPQPMDTSNDYMSARSYSVIFRSLYNSTYLSWDQSEKVLKLLTDAEFNMGLEAGVPKDILVANKFGEHTYIRTDGSLVSRELHDCGIIYYPGHPYFLCVMTKGQDFPKLASVISGISKVVYDLVDSNTQATSN